MLLKNHFYFIEMQTFLELFWAKRSPLIEFIKSQATQDPEEIAEKVFTEKENLNPSDGETAPTSQPEFTALSYNVIDHNSAIFQTAADDRCPAHIHDVLQPGLRRQADGDGVGDIQKRDMRRCRPPDQQASRPRADMLDICCEQEDRQPLPESAEESLSAGSAADKRPPASARLTLLHTIHFMASPRFGPGAG